MENVFYDVLRMEARALEKLKNSFQPTFSVLGILKAMTGTLIVSGVGKSGLIAAKIASTMRSLGISSTYIQASHGVHGDMGMMAPGDVLLALSKSGEAEDLRLMMNRASQCDVPVILITAKPHSTLANLSTGVLLLPEFDEACVLRLAPTTSTTMMLAIGDALAVALSYSNSYTKEEFQINHPAGTLGK